MEDDSRHGIDVKPEKMRVVSSNNKLNDIDPHAYDYVDCIDDKCILGPKTDHIGINRLILNSNPTPSTLFISFYYFLF